MVSSCGNVHHKPMGKVMLIGDAPLLSSSFFTHDTGRLRYVDLKDLRDFQQLSGDLMSAVRVGPGT